MALMLISVLSLNFAKLPPESGKIPIFTSSQIATPYLLSQILNELIYSVQPSFLAPQKSQRRLLEAFQPVTLLSPSHPVSPVHVNVHCGTAFQLKPDRALRFYFATRRFQPSASQSFECTLLPGCM